MTGRDLAAEAARFLATRPEGAGFREVARALHARAEDVRTLLRLDARFAGPFPVGRRHVYTLAIFTSPSVPEPSETAAGVSL